MQIQLTIPPAREADALAAFLHVHPNTSGETDENWLREKTRQWLAETINDGRQQLDIIARHVPFEPVARDDTIVTKRSVGVIP